MPTFETLPRITADLQDLTLAQRRRFRHVVLDAFVPDLPTGSQFRPGLQEARRFAGSGRSLTGNPSARLWFRRGTSGFRQLVDEACQ